MFEQIWVESSRCRSVFSCKAAMIFIGNYLEQQSGPLLGSQQDSEIMQRLLARSEIVRGKSERRLPAGIEIGSFQRLDIGQIEDIL